MWKISIRQLVYNWKNLLGVFIALLLSAVLIGTFSLLLTNSIYAIANPAVVDYQSQTVIAALSLSGTLVALSFFMGLSAIFSALVLSINIRWAQFVQLRILGMSASKLRLLICLENLVFAIIGLIVSAVVSIPLADAIINFMKANAILPSSFHIFMAWKMQWIYMLATVVLVLLITYLSVLPLGNIHNFLLGGEIKKRKWLRQTINIVIGLCFLGGAITLTVIPDLMHGGLGTGMIFLSILCWLLFVMILGKWCFKIIFKCILMLVWPFVFAKLVVQQLLHNFARIILPLGLIISLIMFLGYGINTSLIGRTATNWEHTHQLVDRQGKVIVPDALSTQSSDQQDVNNDNVMHVAVVLIIFEVAIFNCLVGGNAIIQYIISKATLFRNLRLLGMTRGQLLRLSMLEYCFVSGFILICSILPQIYLYLRFTSINGVPLMVTDNPLWFILSIVFVLSGLFVIYLITSCLIIYKKA